MDNTFFVGLNEQVVGIIGASLLAVVLIAVLLLGAVIGRRLYYRFTWMSAGTKGDSYYGSDEHFENWKKAGRP